MNQSKKNKFYNKGKNKYNNQPFQSKKKEEVKKMTSKTNEKPSDVNDDGVGGVDWGSGSLSSLSSYILDAYSSPNRFLSLNDSLRFEIKTEKLREEKQKSEPKKIMRPKEIKNHLDQYVIGQEEAKIALSVAVYNHYKRININLEDDGIEIQKSNILMLGNSGCGKTLLAQTIAKILDVPFVSVDATVFTPTGYVGKDVETIISNLIKMADGDKHKAEIGIVYIDEFDKISNSGNSRFATHSGGSTRNFGGDIQAAFLKLIEGSELEVKTESQSIFGSSTTKINTKNILFICGGAFAGIEDLIQKEEINKTKTIGFGADILANKCENINEDVWDKIGTEEIIKYGMMPEIVGRLPVILKLKPLEKNDLVNILTQPKNAIVRQYQKLLNMDGIRLDFSLDALELIAEMAIKSRTGARGLRGILEKVMTRLMFNIPDDEYERQCIITSEHIRNNLIPELNMTVDLEVLNSYN